MMLRGHDLSLVQRLTDKGSFVSVLGQAAHTPSGAAGAASISDRERAARIVAVRDSLAAHLAELDALGLTLPAALLDNAIAEIR
jgi:hypothetical protein